MSIVRVGATKQYSDNWENIFSGGGRKAPASKTSSARSNGKSAKKSPKKSEKATKKKSGAKKRKGK
jgi:hypothetical protein